MILKNKIKSPLRYPGGKSRGVVEILKYIPDGIDSMVSPFIGGGSVELACASNGISVQAYDNFEPLVEFWQCILENPIKLASHIGDYYPLSKFLFKAMQINQSKLESKYKRAAIFFVLNRASFSGTTLSGGMSTNHPRFTLSSIRRVADFKVDNLTINCMDFKESIAKSDGKLLYLDPPYPLKNYNLYGEGRNHKAFDHDGLANILHSRDNWILSYSDTEYVRNLYYDYTIVRPKWRYGMSNDKTSKEVLILSNDIVYEIA